MWVTYLVDTDESVSEPVVKVVVHAKSWSVKTGSGIVVEHKDIIGIIDDITFADQTEKMVDPMVAFYIMRDHAKTDDQKRLVSRVEQMMRQQGVFKEDEG